MKKAMQLSEKEIELIKQYRNAPSELKFSIDKLLDISDESAMLKEKIIDIKRYQPI